MTNTPSAPESPTPAEAGEEASAAETAGAPSGPPDPAAADPQPATERGEAPEAEPSVAGDRPAPSGDTWAPPPASPAPSGDTWGPPPAAPSGDTWAPPPAGAAPASPAPSGDTWGPPPASPAPSGDTWAPAGSGPGNGDATGDLDDGDDGESATVVLGGVGTAAQPAPPAPRLSPDAVAATTSTRVTDPHGMSAVRARITPPGGTTRLGDAEGEVVPRHLRDGEETGERRRSILLLAAPVLIVVLFLVGWAVDSAALSGQVMRNVEVSGRPVGGLGEASLPEVMTEIADEAAERPVQIVNGDQTYETTAGAIGLTVDEEATADAALDAGRNDSVFVRPFKWLGSFFGSRDVPVRYAVSEGAAALTLAQLQGGDATAPTEPAVVFDGGTGQFEVRPGQTGTGINAQDVAADLPGAAEESATGPIVIQADSAEVQPQYTDQAAQELADEANAMTAEGLTLRVRDTTVEVSTEQLRTWIGQAPAEQGFELAINGDQVAQDLPQLFTGLTEPQDATVTLVNGQPQVRPGRDGVTCCNPNSAERIWNALGAGQAEVDLEAGVAEPEVTTQEAEAWGIREPIGGNRAWRDGAEAPGPAPGFTTYHAAGGARVTNIHRMADLVRGAVIPPDGTFSINDHVGVRTRENGFVEAGAIRYGHHVPEVGGGVSQFATTTFNAAYFAGLDIEEYQAHTEYFPRYPRGREATMGHPSPDLQIHNNTPYGILIWTSYTDTSLTVTMYSTPHIRAEQTGISESPTGVACTTVVTTRTRTWIEDGRTDTDTFRATYRRDEGINCEGQPIQPPPGFEVPAD